MGGGFSVCRNFFFPPLAYAWIFFSGETLCTNLFFGRQTPFLSFLTMFNDRYVYGFQYNSSMQFFFLF